MPLFLLLPLWLTSATALPAPQLGDVEAVELRLSRYQALRETAREQTLPPEPWVSDREVELRPVAGGFEVHARWRVEAERPGWLVQQVMGSGLELHTATLNGAPAPLLPSGDGVTLVAWIERASTLEIRARLPGSVDDLLQLELMPATRGKLRVVLSDRVPAPVTPEGSLETPETAALLAGGVIWSGGPRVDLRLVDPDRAPPARETLAVARAGLGLTVGDAELRGSAHLEWQIRHGSLSRVRANVQGLGEDLTVEGDNVSTWSRQGDTLEVELKAPATGRVDLQLRWTVAIPPGDENRVALPRVEPEAWRTESTLQLARDGELEVIPEVDGWTAVAAAELPSWSRGLVEGTPTAAYQHAGSPAGGHLDLLRFVPVPGPSTVVDVASYTAATTDEGRILMRAHYELRNDRGSHLTVQPPPGLKIIGARVAGETALPSRDGDAWRIPLKRSLETVEGLLSFPVEVTLLGEQEDWSRRERRQLALPTLDAPIAASRVTLYLPPRYRSRLEPGEHNVVESFGEGEELTYGLGVGGVGSAVSDTLFQEAVQGYLENDFESAQRKLEELESLGVSNENMSRLQANLDVIEGKDAGTDKGDLTLQRRVKEQAKARAAEDFRRQEALITEAEQAAEAGNYAQAEQNYQAALELGGKLEKLEQAESVEQQSRNLDVADELKVVTKKKGKKSKLLNRRSRPRKQAKSKVRLASADQPSRYRAPSSASAVKVAEGSVRREASARGAQEAVDTPASASDQAAAISRGDGTAPVVNAPPAGDLQAAVPTVRNLSEIEELELLQGEDHQVDLSGRDEHEEVVEEERPEPEPEPEPEAESNYEMDAAALASAPARRSRRVQRRTSRRGRRVKHKRYHRHLDGGGVSTMNAGGFSRPRPRPRSVEGPADRDRAASDDTAADEAAFAGKAEKVTIYDYDYDVVDDDVDGEMLRPDGDVLRPDGTAPSGDDARLAPLPRPKVNASALSVVIPATGQAIRYEQLLIEANQTQTIKIDARLRRLRRR